MDLYYLLKLPPSAESAQVELLIDTLNRLDVVEIAYPESVPQLAGVDIAPPTPDFEFQQTPLDAPPLGVNARYAWGLVGGTGENMKFIDVEGAWRTTHEDLKPRLFSAGNDIVSIIEHGTAVLGVVVGDHNGFGISGIATGAPRCWPAP